MIFWRTSIFTVFPSRLASLAEFLILIGLVAELFVWELPVISLVRRGNEITSVSDPYSFDTDPDPVFLVEYSADLDPDPIRIQGFDDQIWKKFTAGKKSWVANISANFQKNRKGTNGTVYSGAWGKLIHEKKPEVESRATVPLRQSCGPGAERLGAEIKLPLDMEP